jgi:DNA-binding NarL/FixJ family response regulator
MGYGGIAKLMQAVAQRHLVDEVAAEASLLTKTELAVLQALAEGRGPKDIALESGRSVYTIQAHIQNIIKKLGCSGRNEALTMARKRGLL